MQPDQESNPGDKFNVPEGLCRRFSLAEILAATDNFNDSFYIGQGGSAKVYKGEIDNGAHTVAIKKSKSMSPELRKEFQEEILMVSKFQHSHLVSLIGYCETDNEMILVYEYMAGGTLDENLYKIGRNGKNNVPLCWVERLKICIGAARGLDYLHTGTGINNKVIHRDVKSSNILLDKTRATAKILDFGVSKIGPANQADTRVFTRVVGTSGYLDPDYYNTGVLTSKSDVYAFGVVLFELLCGRPAVDLTLDEDQRGLAGWACLCVKKGKVEQIIDPNLKSEILPRSLLAYVKVAAKCLRARPKERPAMTEVLAELVLALSLQESGNRNSKKSGSKMAEKLMLFFSGTPRPIPAGNFPIPPISAGSSMVLASRRNQHPTYVADNFKSLDEVISAIGEVGLESLNIILGIDFTKSNEWTGRDSFNGKSLHAISGLHNPYEQTISMVGRAFSPFDKDNLIPCFGFGDASTHAENVFSFYPDHRPCHGPEEALARYREIVPYLRLAGPTSFSPIIDAAIDIVERSNGQYHVLVIIADGQVTRGLDAPDKGLSPQENATINSIVAASEYPLSIILVGVGDGPWDAMKQFDDNFPQRAFDNFQFVNFTEIMSKETDMAKKETAFALAALMEIPFQYRATQSHQYLDRKIGGPRTRPLPPPCEVIEHKQCC